MRPPGYLIILTCCLRFISLPAQSGNINDQFSFQVSSPIGTKLFEYGECGFGKSTFGGHVDHEICAPIVWAYDITPDSLCCDTIQQDLSGKIALIRRGNCDLALKAINACKAGAVGVLIANHYQNSSQTDCFYMDMSTIVDFLDTIGPCIFLSRAMSDYIDQALALGLPVNGCFLLPRTGRAMGPYHNATPVTQVDTLRHMGMRFINRSPSSIDSLVIKADITGPNAYHFSYITPVPSIAPGLDTFLRLKPYMPPAMPGTYELILSNNFYTESRDTLRRKFWITPFTFASDNLSIKADGGPAPNECPWGTIYQVGNIIFAGPDGGKAVCATFGIANVNSVWSPGVDNAVYTILYNADADGDGQTNLTSDWTDLASDVIATGIHIIDGTETETELLDVPLVNYANPDSPVVLQPHGLYYLTLFYDGTFIASGHSIAFSNTEWSDYLNFPSTPMFFSQFFEQGWADRTIIIRLQMEGYVPVTGTHTKPALLPDLMVDVSPNPAKDYLDVALNSEKYYETLDGALFNARGETVSRYKLDHFDSEPIRLDLKVVPAGHYLLVLRTLNGYAVRKVVVCK